MSREIGNKAEDRAVDFLVDKGYKIVDRNFTIRGGEIDIIAKKKKSICFVEVKYRNNSQYGLASEYITKSKLEKILKTAKLYLQDNNLNNLSWQIDAIVIDDEQIDHLENVFVEGLYI